MKTEEVKALKKQLKDEYEADDAAIERVLRLLGSRNGKNTETSQEPYGTLESRVVSAIALLPNQFALADIIAKLGETYPNEEINRASVSSVIFRLKEENKIA